MTDRDEDKDLKKEGTTGEADQDESKQPMKRKGDGSDRGGQRQNPR